MRDLRTSLVEALKEARLVHYTDKPSGASMSRTNEEAAEIAADVVLERLEEVGVFEPASERVYSKHEMKELWTRDLDQAVYRWREPNRAEEVG